MRTVTITEAKTHLSRLVDRVADGESFVITKRGIPVVKVSPLDSPVRAQRQRLGFLKGEIEVPDDFDTMNSAPSF
jgi:prevent-host-death family protein